MFSKLFAPTEGVELNGVKLKIRVPSMYFTELIEDNFLPQVAEALHKELGPDADLEYEVMVDRGDQNTGPLGYSLPANGIAPNSNPKPAPKSNAKAGLDPFSTQRMSIVGHDGNLSDQYTFDNFVEADCNKFAVAAGIRISTAPGTSGFNPLLIYGGVGLGKTHLVQAIGNRIKQLHPEKVVIYVTLEQFFHQFLDAIKNENVNALSNFYMGVDVLIVDDIQFLAGKDKTQEMFFNIFNRLHQYQKQIILTSDCPPKELKGMMERLLTRFKWGVTADLQAPGFETRLAILSKKLEKDGVAIPYEVLEYLASSIDTNIRELTGVLISLIARGTLSSNEIDLALAKQVIKSFVSEMPDVELNIETITKLVSEYYRIPEEVLKANSRKRDIVIPRQVAMYLTKELTRSSLQIIGNFFGGKDHTTVMHAIKQVQRQLAEDDDMRQAIDTLQRRLQAN